MKMKNKIIFLLVFLLMTSFSKKTDKCEVKNNSKEMLRSNSVNLSFCIPNKLMNEKNTIGSSGSVIILVENVAILKKHC